MSGIRLGKRGVPLVFLLMVPIILSLAAAAVSRAQVAVTVAFAPPELPVYEQPLCPAENYLWAPGYWAWDGDDYYWVPGTWVMAPEVGLLWTPGYWGWGGGGYVWYPGYWGPAVGFYGGIVYGFGYFGHGYEGGRWEGGHFFYNRTVNNVNVTVIHNVYNTTIENRNVNVTRVSYNGGNGGVNVRPTSQEEAAARERRVEMTPAQRQHLDAARQNRELRASVNRGRPPVAASARPAEFHGQNVVAASEGRYTPPPNRGNGGQPGGAGGNPRAIHPNDLPPYDRPNTTNANPTKEEQKYQKQQEKMYQKEVQDRQKLQQQQDKEHQQAQKRQADEQYKQQMEQRHQQQTEQMQQRHVQQQQQMQQHAPPPHPAPPPHEAPPPHH